MVTKPGHIEDCFTRKALAVVRSRKRAHGMAGHKEFIQTHEGFTIIFT